MVKICLRLKNGRGLMDSKKIEIVLYKMKLEKARQTKVKIY